MTKVTDEMLMAYVDGELDGAAAKDVRRAVEADAALERRAESLRSTRRIAREALAPLRAEPVPEQLIATVLGSVNSNVAPARRSWTSALPLAACVAIVAGLSGYWLASQTNRPAGDLLNNPAIAEALGITPGGAERVVQTGAGPAQLKALATYRIEGGVCRTFEFADGAQAIRGVGCSQDGNWRINVAVSTTASGNYAPASAPAAIDAFLDALDAEGPLSVEEEAALTKRTR